MSNEFKAEIERFISRSLDDIRCGRAEYITGQYIEGEIRVRITIEWEDEKD